MTARARRNFESFKQYRMHLKDEQALEEKRLRPRVLWDSSKGRTYKRAVHGPLTS